MCNSPTSLNERTPNCSNESKPNDSEIVNTPRHHVILSEANCNAPRKLSGRGQAFNLRPFLEPLLTEINQRCLASLNMNTAV